MKTSVLPVSVAVLVVTLEALAAGRLQSGVPTGTAGRSQHRILFSELAPAASTIAIANADGIGERVLVRSSSLDYNAAWSPVGDWIAFTSEREGSADLYRIKPDGTALERLTDSPAYDDQAAFSPDGRQIVFVTTRAAGRANLWILDSRTRKLRPLTAGNGGDFRPSWSPDGRWIAFSSDRGSAMPFATNRFEHQQIADVYVVRPDGSGLRRVTPHGDFCGSPKWYPGSTRLIVYCMSADETYLYRRAPAQIRSGETRLVSIDLNTETLSAVTVGPGVKMSPAITPSGAVAYIRKDGATSGLVYVNGDPGPAGNVRSPSWSPDGAHVVYHRLATPVATRGLPTFGPLRRKWTARSGFELTLTGDFLLPALDPTGKHAVAGTGLADLVTADVESGRSRAIFHRDGQGILGAQWSRRGDAVVFGLGAFFGGRDAGAQVAIIQADGSGFRQLTSGPNDNGFPSMAPDDRHVVYRTFGPQGEGLRIVNLENGSVSTLTTDYDNFPVWSPRGDLIAFVRRYIDDYEIYSIKPDGTALRRLTASKGNDGHIAFSSDGRRIAFSSSRMGFKDEAIYTDNSQPYGELFVMRVDGTDVVQLTDNQWEDAGPAWADGRRPTRSLRR